MPDTTIKVKFDNPNVTALVVWVVRRWKPANKPARHRPVRAASTTQKDKNGYFVVTFDRVPPVQHTKVLARIAGLDVKGWVRSAVTRRISWQP